MYSNSIISREKPVLGNVDRVRLAEAFLLSDALDDQIWKGWRKAPFAVILITPEYEFLMRHSHPSEDFILVGYDSLLQSSVYYRKRTFPTNLLATFPAVGGVPTIVIGQAENTIRKTSTPWMLTVLHEHFHQLQYSQPDYYEAVNSLNLSGGDQTGMWMLNYAFPYSSPEVKKQFSKMSQLLAKTLQTGQEAEFTKRFSAYMKARQKFKNMLSVEDYRYFSFQVWQEGVARYTEYRIARWAASQYQPSQAFRSLKDYEPFQKMAEHIRDNIFKELSIQNLQQAQRVAFYAFGAAEALLLDKINPGWHKRYFVDKFYLESFFNEVPEN